METCIKTGEEAIKLAARLIRQGETVAFPTETVYGLGADVFQPEAIKKIYIAKGRPSDNPLIAHVSSYKMLERVAVNVSEDAKKLMQAFWPGPLTVILQKRENVPDAVCAGLPTIAVRMPQNEIALRIIEEADTPIAAPSANSSGKPSPTSAGHVFHDMNGKIPLIVDGGECSVGVESTIVDLSVEIPTVLRPGIITPEEIQAVLGRVELDPTLLKKPAEGMRPKAPGMKYKHYSPNADVIVFQGEQADNLLSYIQQHDNGKKVGILCGVEKKAAYESPNVEVILPIGRDEDAKTMCKGLYEGLRKMDEMGMDVIYAEALPVAGEGIAYMNRLLKAAGYCVIEI